MGIGRPARHPTRSKPQLSAVTPPLTHAAECGSRRDLYRQSAPRPERRQPRASWPALRTLPSTMQGIRGPYCLVAARLPPRRRRRAHAAAEENARRCYTGRRDGHTYRVIDSLILGERFEALAEIATPSSRRLRVSRFGRTATRSSVFGSFLITCVPGEGSGIDLCGARRVGWRETHCL